MYRKIIASLFTLSLSLFVFSSALIAAPGDLDTAFSQDGKVFDSVYDPASEDIGSATAVQADGKILVAGTLDSSRELLGIIRYNCGIARYNTDGSLDTTFDGDGKVQTTFVSSFVCYSLVIQPDGKILVGGSTAPSGAGADFMVMRFNTNGSLDTTFNGTGRVTTNISGYDSINALILQPDGKIVAAGVTNQSGNSNFALARYNSNGPLDTSFNGTGKVITDFFSTIDYANAAAIQPDGKIVVGGYCIQNSWQDYAMARYNTDGSLDTAFDGDGKLAINLSPNGQADLILAVGVQADGKIITSGSLGLGSFTLVRFNANGSLDTTFDGDGIMSTVVSNAGFGDGAKGLAIQSDGKYVMAGAAHNNGTWTDIALARVNPDGSLDTTFDGDGILTTDYNNTYESANAVAIMPDGRIVAGGYFTFASDYEFSVVRYNANGALDTSFDSDGKTYTPMGVPLNTSASDVAVQSDGKVVVAGYGNNGVTDDFLVARYKADGSPDSSFGTGGIVTYDLSFQNPFGDRASCVAIQPDGKIVVGGVTNTSGNNPDFALVRFTTNGGVDTTFGSNGIVVTSFGSSEYINDIAIQPDGKIVAVGYVYVSSAYDIAVARYNPNGSLDTSFDGDGKLTTDFAGGGDRADAVAIQADGKIVIAGQASTGPGFDFALVRYNVDGSLDTAFDGDGKLTTDITNSNDAATSIEIQPNGRIIAAGAGGSGNGVDYVMARYNANGSLDTSFDGDGKVVTSILPGRDIATGMVLLSDGRIVLAGNSFNGSNDDVSLARYNADGSLDGSFGSGGTRTFDLLNSSNDIISGVAIDPAGRLVVAGETGGSIKSLAIARLRSDLTRLAAPFDFDGDGKTDLSIFRPATGDWWYSRSSDGQSRAFGFGNSSDKLVPGDFTGDGKSDIAVWRPASGEWFVLRSEDVSYFSVPFGTNGDVPVPSDYDADGKTDIAVYRPANSTWYVNRSSGGTVILRFGAAGDVPVPSDYDGDGLSDVAIFRPSLGQWWLNRSTAGLLSLTFGNSLDKPVQGDFTGDGKSDVAFYRPSSGEWFVLRSETGNTFYAFPFGSTNDVPLTGDFDGDGKSDAAVFRPSNSTWYVNRSTGGTITQVFGQAGDIAVPSVFVP